MYTCGPMFFGPPVGDHPPDDGLTRLQVRFAGGSSADESSYAVGSGTISESAPGNVTLLDGYVSVYSSGATTNYITWSANGLGMVTGEGYTVEFFARVVEVDLNPFGQQYFGTANCWNMGASRIGMSGVTGGINPMMVYADTFYSWTDTGVDIYSKLATFKHIAFVVAPGSSTLRVYVSGVQVVTYPGGATSVNLLYPGSVDCGGVGDSASATRFQFSGVRIRRAEMYTGASFLPPSSPAAWGAP